MALEYLASKLDKNKLGLTQLENSELVEDLKDNKTIKVQEKDMGEFFKNLGVEKAFLTLSEYPYYKDYKK